MAARNKAISLAVLAGLVLLLPLLLAPAFNELHSPLWFLRSTLALVILLVLLFSSCRLLRPTWLRMLVTVLLAELLALFMNARLVSFYLQGESFNDRFFFHASFSTLTEAAGSYPVLLLLSVLYLALVPLLACLVVAGSAPASTTRPRHLLGMTLLVFLLEPDLNALIRSSVDSALATEVTFANLNQDRSGLHLEALEPRLEGVTAGKNLLLIYLESLEKLYTEESIFPGLTPYLSSLKANSLYFSDMQQTAGTSWTVAGILSSQCGTPLMTQIGPNGNDILQSGFLNEATCMGDVLRAAGYRQSFIGGASTRFAGKGTFLKLHGYDEVLGVDELSAHLEDPNYLNNWGLYDDSTFAEAESKFAELASDPARPFNLTMLTVDTHHPIGMPSQSCTPYAAIDNATLHAVHCTDQLLRQFIEKLQQHPAWQNTLVVIASDHLAMRNIAQELYPPDYKRELFVLMLNAGETREVAFPASHMDLAPTILNRLGVRHEQRFLAGDNLMNPQIAERTLNFADPERLATIKYINYNLFTRIETDICSQDKMITTSDDHFMVGNRGIYMGVGGQPIPLENLYDRHSMVVLLNSDGRFQSTVAVNTRNLPFVLYQARDYTFLLVTSGVAASQLVADVDPAAPVAVLFGSMEGKIRSLGSFADVHDVEVSSKCPTLVAQAQQDIRSSATVKLGDICKNPEQSPTSIETATGRIVFGKVAVDNHWYSAVLQGNDAGIYRIIKQTGLGPIDPADPLDYCHAYLGRSQVLVPVAQSEEGPLSLVLEQVPGTNDQFRLTSKILF